MDRSVAEQRVDTTGVSAPRGRKRGVVAVVGLGGAREPVDRVIDAGSGIAELVEA